MKITNDCHHYEDDEIMADFGRSIIDQYIGWCDKYGEPTGLKGWASYAKNTIGNMLDDYEDDA